MPRCVDCKAKEVNMRFVYPNGLVKALTFSYDDGQEYDRKLVEIFNKYGFKGTFHLNSGKLDGTTGDEDFVTSAEVPTLYEGHEVACHGVNHLNMPALSIAVTARELSDDRIDLENLTGKLVQGFSYPFGGYSPEVIAAAKAVGIKYARTVNATHDFWPPADFMQWHPTCHHADNAIELGKRFMNVPGYMELPLMYVWGHSFEFGRSKDWTVIEEFCELMAGKDDIWYATNMEICDYLTAIRKLEYSADGCMIQNPSAISVWFISDSGELTEIKPGQCVVNN